MQWGTQAFLEQNRDPRNKPSCIYAQLVFHKATKSSPWRKESPFKNNVEKIGYPHADEWNWTPILNHSQKLNQNGLKN